MGKNEYKNPTVEELVVGNTLPMYDNYKEQEDFSGNAELLAYEPSWNPEYTWVIAEVGNSEVRQNHVINWSSQRWKIRYLDGKYAGHVTHRNIGYFYSIDAYQTSEYVNKRKKDDMKEDKEDDIKNMLDDSKYNI